MSSPWRVAVGLAAAACQTPPPSRSDARSAYLAVVSDRQVAPGPGLEACQAIHDPTLAGDCALYVVMVEARRREGQPARWCEQVPEGTWRDECWFVAAEAARRNRKLEASATLCMEAGAFKDDCAQHLWQSEVHGLIHRKGPESFASALPAAEAVHAKWSPLLSEKSDFDARFWTKFFQNGFEGRGGFVDLGHCDALSAPHSDRCVAAATEMYGRELAPRLSDARLDVCTVPVPEDGRWSASIVEWVPAAPDARLDEVVADRRASCTGR